MFKSQFWNKKVDKNLINIRETRTKTSLAYAPRSVACSALNLTRGPDVKYYFLSNYFLCHFSKIIFFCLSPAKFQSEVEVSNLLITIFGENYQFFITMNFLPVSPSPLKLIPNH